MVNNVHVGVGAQASRKGAKWKGRLGAVGVGKVNLGKLGYPIGALLSAFHPPSWRMRVEVDGRVVNDVDRPVLMVAIGNGGNVGGGTELNPDADTEDGRLDVMVSRAVTPMAKLGYVAKLRNGDQDDRDDVLMLRGKTVKVSGDEFWISADGEISGPERSRSWRLEPAAYSMILPRPDRSSALAAVVGAGLRTRPRAGVRASRDGRPRRRPGSGCPPRARPSARRRGGARCAG